MKIELQKELSQYDLEGKWNDYVGVQKVVLNQLRAEQFFENNYLINESSGMVVKLTSKGIKETLGKGKRFQNLPKQLKQLKIATIRHLPLLIKQGMLIADDVSNIHGEKELFAYIIAGVNVDEHEYGVRIAVKKKVSDNVFWIHSIDCNEKSLELLDLHSIRSGT